MKIINNNNRRENVMLISEMYLHSTNKKTIVFFRVKLKVQQSWKKGSFSKNVRFYPILYLKYAIFEYDHTPSL